MAERESDAVAQRQDQSEEQVLLVEGPSTISG